ncbi:transposase [Caldivirga maquilingensis]|uniref:transposase n=1 Tax=Caldivirga maquilingensis TaxID=76887 RepID=UPI0018DBF8C5|nr:transposase [Caldivirga maquilingensis]
MLRNDQYRIEGDRIVLRGLGAVGGIEVWYKGLIHIRGKQGRMEMHHDLDGKKWYAHIVFEVEEKMVRGSSFRIPLKPVGDKEAGVDAGVNNLLVVYIDDSALLVSGRPLKAISLYWRGRIDINNMPNMQNNGEA